MAPHFSIQPSILGLIHDPARPRSWQELFDKSDIVSLHVALNVSQRQGRQTLQSIGPIGPILFPITAEAFLDWYPEAISGTKTVDSLT